MLDIFQAESRRSSAENVRRILITGGRAATSAFRRNVKIRLYALIIKAPAPDGPGGLIRDLGSTMRAARPVGSVAFSPVLELMGGEFRLVVGSPSSGWIPLEGGTSLRVRYGIEGKRSICSGDITFRILLGGGAPGERRLLWEDGRQSEAGKEWSGETTVRLPAVTGQQSLYFETSSTARSCGVEGAYWSDLRVEPYAGGR